MTTVDEPVALDGTGMVPMSAPTQTEPEPIDPKYLDLLRELGFTEIPTAAEVKAKLDERRDLTRTTVLVEADKGRWCYDGTRRVLANLRLPRAGERQTHIVRAQVSFTVEYHLSAFSYASAAEQAHTHYLNADMLRQRLAGHRITNLDITSIEQEEATHD